MPMKSFAERISKHTNITDLQKRDKQRVNRILKSISRRGGLAAPGNLRREFCGDRTLRHAPKRKSEEKGITPRRYYAYLEWLRKNNYIAQERRGKKIQLTFKGKEHVNSSKKQELLNREALAYIDKVMPEALKKIAPHDVSKYVEAAVKQEAIGILRRQLLEAYPATWKEQLETTHRLLDLILKLDPKEMRRLRDLLDRYMRLERLDESRRKSKYEIVDGGQTLVLRDRETGLIYPGLVIHKIPEKKEKG